MNNHKSIPLTENQWVEREIKSFTGPERKAFEEGYRRSGFYKDWIQDELRKAGLPEELVWLPIVESWFMPQARPPLGLSASGNSSGRRAPVRLGPGQVCR